ncbi:MAG: hypothetical protein WD004_05235 [Actinomycetota bacterium]
MPPDDDNVIPFPGAGAQPQLGDAVEPERALTIVMAELRGWSDIVERIGEQPAQRSLASAIDRVLDVLGQRGATNITVEGGANQPTVAAAFEGPNGPIRGLDAAVAIRRAVSRAQSPAPPEHQFRVGTGVDAGEVVASQTPDGVPFDAVGTIRMCAAKLKDFAGPGQIFFSETIFARTDHLATAQSLGAVRVNPHGETQDAYSLTDLRTS